MADDVDRSDGRCWQCGYLLRGVESGRCPECGRAFDRADRASMNFGRPPGRVGRWMVSGVGWWLVGLAAVACGLVWATVRRPVGAWRWSLVDVPYYGRAWQWRGRLPAAGAVDVMYMAGMWLAAIIAAWWVVRVGLRAVGVWRYRPRLEDRGRFWRRGALLVGLSGATLAGMGFGWPYRLGQRWAREYAARDLMYVAPFTPSFAEAGAVLSAEDGAAVVRQLVLRGDAREKGAGLKLLVELSPHAVSLPLLCEAAESEADPAVAALEVHLIGAYRDAETLPLLRRLLASRDAAVRAAAADAIGIVRRPAFWVYPDQQWRAADGTAIPIRTRGDPPIILPVSSVPRDAVVDVGAETLAALEAMAAGDVTPDEREAAARALLGTTPEGRLRYAEWGVFLGDGVGRLQFAMAQLDEAPPFVHRVGNPAKDLEARIWTSRPNFKPVIHLTTPGPGPVVVRLDVAIAHGRPWVAYPRFDDLIADVRGLSPAFEPFTEREEAGDGKGRATAPRSASAVDPPLPPVGFELREGYPWLTPGHRDVDAGVFTPNLTRISGIGVTWQTLVVTPTRLGWMRPAVVGADARFAWWERLRGVESSWVSSRGESERFLYYDGPTIRPALMRVRVDGRRLAWDLAHGGRGGGDDSRAGCYVEVAADGSARGAWVDGASLRQSGAAEIGGAGGPALEAITPADLLGRLTARGLTASEAAGMVDCWKRAFIETPGRRFLLFMSEGDYDDACPMNVDPRPAERVRVGVELTELGKVSP